MSKASKASSQVEEAVSIFLNGLQLEAHPETIGTPRRVSQMWSENLVSGYRDTPASVLRDTIQDESDTTVVLEHIPFHGICPHHLVPFFGTVDLCYEPRGRIVGLGALEKLVAVLSRRLTLQETLTGQLVDALMTELDARGAACKITGQHLCLMLRGREPRGTSVITYAFRGSLENAYAVFSTPKCETTLTSCGG